MNFNAVLNLRTETANQPGVVILEFLPEPGLNAGKLTMAVPPADAAGLEVGANYLFQATKVEEPVEEVEEGADG